jgi:hypothetical protein
VDFEDVGEIGGLVGSWRLIVGIVFTCGLCLIVIFAIPNEILRWAICLPVGIGGSVLSVRWQVRSDRGK